MAAIRAHIAGNATGITRDDTIVSEVVKLLHAKTFDEIKLRRRKNCYFYRLEQDDAASVANRIRTLLNDAETSANARDGTAGDADFSLQLDDESIAYAVGQLHHYSILEAERDVLGEAFESLIGPTLRGAEGQFFTPRNVTRMCVDMISPKPGERVLDPACGAGGFLGDTLAHLARHSSRARGKTVGIDKDAFLATLCRDHLALYHQKHSIFCDNALAPPDNWSEQLQKEAPLGSFDVILTNPPFGAAIPVKGTDVLSQYDLAWKWVKSATGIPRPLDERVPSRPPQTLFIERCVQFLRPGGRAAIVLPEGILGNENELYIREWIRAHAHILAIVDCPLETFMPSTPTKTCVLFLQKRKSSDDPPPSVYVAIAEHCGHDRRGRPVTNEDGARRDDFPEIARNYKRTDKA